LNALGDSGTGERVRITSLDAEDQARDWGAIDFIKIDAEGEEERILAGAGGFFAKHSPLVMFEITARGKRNDKVPSAFVEMGFELYRLLDGAPVLVPVEAEEHFDQYELNLFAAKPDRAAALAREGLLVEAVPTWAPDDDARAKAMEFFEAQPFAPIFAQLPGGAAAANPVYRDALAGYAMWRSSELSLPARYAALRFACDTLTALVNKEASLSRLSTLARMAFEMGRRTLSVNALKIMANVLKGGSGRIMEPFWPANPRFDNVAPGANVIEWFVVAVLEQYEQIAFHSSRFGSAEIDLDWLSRQPLVSIEIERRRVLQHALAGQTVEVPPRLLVAAPDHLNADIWQRGLVPNTIPQR
jgi:hypothetical protein